MNGKIKAVVITALVLGLVASAIYVAPTLAYMNGDTDQVRDRDMDRVRDRDCVCDCDQDQTQTRTRLHLQECAQNQTSMGPTTWQHQYEHQFKYQNMFSP